MYNARIGIFLIASCLALLWACSLAITIEYDANAIIINGERRLIISGAIHYPRSTSQMWPNLIQKAKDGGLDAIETYVFWDLHEPTRRQYDFSGNLDLIKFIKNIQEAGLYVVLRIGPYVCAEWNYGGFPMWLHNLPGIQLRTDNAIYKEEMRTFTTKIVNICKDAGLFAPQGGPIILAQIENEYGDVISHYGEAGNAYIKWCAQMALAQNIGVPWIMCKQSNAPASMINTCNGYYCDNFTPNNPKSPKMFTENWIGWFQKWGEKRPHRTVEDTAFSVARFFQKGGVLQNYYMYHGGTNFGRTAGGPYITTAYDYDAPLDEYGNLNQPKWGHLRDLHAAIKLGEKLLTNGTVTEKQYGDLVYLTTYANNATGEKFCFLSNSHNSKDAQVDLQQDGKYYIPAWSVSILQDCKKEVFNTAKVNAQTSTYVKKPAAEGKSLNWVWTIDPMEDTFQGKGTFKVSQLLEQKGVVVGASDYLWYMTNVVINDTSSWKNATLQVNTTGHVLHAFVNGQYIGAQWGKYDNLRFVYEKPIALNQGTNIVSLLSGTVGHAHYGAFFDLQETGIVGGPVKLIGSDSKTTLDLSTASWSYKVGLNGEARRFYDPKSLNGVQWDMNSAPIKRPMTWYKTTFETPEGTNSVVLDLQGLGKGHAWVNGQSIGRYWPTMVAEKNGCSDTCDYRGNYGSEKCVSGCGEPSQRFYHVPRSFLSNNDTNTLILFEEIGGNPFNASVQIVTLSTICATVDYGRTLEVACQVGESISEIQFASYGDPQGKCGSFQIGEWESRHSMAVVENACIGKQSCSIDVTSSTFRIRKGGVNGQLAVQLVCGGSDPQSVRVDKVGLYRTNKRKQKIKGKRYMSQE